MMMRTILAFLFACLAQAAPAQKDTLKMAKKLAPQKITYLWGGIYCPVFKDTKTSYGFTIKCAGCAITPAIEQKNKKAIAAINKVYGKRWFEKNMDRFVVRQEANE